MHHRSRDQLLVFVQACASSGCTPEGEMRDEEGEQNSLKDELDAMKKISEANPACDEKQLEL